MQKSILLATDFLSNLYNVRDRVECKSNRFRPSHLFDTKKRGGQLSRATGNRGGLPIRPRRTARRRPLSAKRIVTSEIPIFAQIAIQPE
jgi:hypothetical protein